MKKTKQQQDSQSGTDKPVEREPGLCHRCEHRVKFLETGTHPPRYECGSAGMSVRSCYMYSPVCPIVQEVNMGDNRPALAGWMISARSHRVAGGKCDLKVKKIGDGFMQYWVPATKGTSKRRKS